MKKLGNKFMAILKQKQIGYMMIVVTLAVTVLFVWMYMTARAEPPSVDSGTNFLFTSIMVMIVFVLVSLTIRLNRRNFFPQSSKEFK